MEDMYMIVHGMLKPGHVQGKDKSVLTIQTETGPLDVDIYAEGALADELAQYQPGQNIRIVASPYKAIKWAGGVSSPMIGFKVVFFDHDKTHTIESQEDIIELLIGKINQYGYPA